MTNGIDLLAHFPCLSKVLTCSGWSFLTGDARAYIVPNWPDGDDVPMVIHMLFHRILMAKSELVDACNYSVVHLEAAREFGLFLEPPP